jgi:hypothetical protein
MKYIGTSRIVMILAALACCCAWAGEQSTRESQNPAKPYSVRHDGQRWSLASPDGKPFFSLGVCVLAQGPSRDSYKNDNPAYASWRYYKEPGDWADASLRRLKSWRFTTVGGWSDYETLMRSQEMTLGIMPVLSLGATAGAPWWDMWDEKITSRMEQVARDQIVKVRDHPRLIGYYSDNEMGWWNAALFKMTLEHAPTSGQRQRLLKLLRETYDDDWEKLLADFEPVEVASFDELDRGGRLYLRPGSYGIRVMRRFMSLVADRYYQLAREIIRKHDSRALVLGDRYQSFYYPEVARASSKYVDVASTNLNAHWNDGTFLRCYLDTLHKLTGRPILVSEFYSSARENRSGNKNSHGVFPLVATQRERAATARRTLEDVARLPYVVGADWFQFADEPTHGREDGEDYNFGLVDIDDRPYEELTAAFANFDADATRRTAGSKRAENAAEIDQTITIPPAPKDPFAGFESLTALKHWDRQRGFVPPVSEFPVADLYACWSSQALYLGVYGWDPIDEDFYRDGQVPEADRPLLTIELKGRPAVRARIGAGRKAAVSDRTVRVENLSGVKLNVRNIAVIELPTTLLNQERLTAGDAVELNVTLDTHARAYQMRWHGRFVLGN